MQKFKMGELVPAKNAHALSEAIFRVKDLKTNRDFIKQAKKAQAFINNKQSAQVLDQIFGINLHLLSHPVTGNKVAVV